MTNYETLLSYLVARCEEGICFNIALADYLKEHQEFQRRLPTQDEVNDIIDSIGELDTDDLPLKMEESPLFNNKMKEEILTKLNATSEDIVSIIDSIYSLTILSLDLYCASNEYLEYGVENYYPLESTTYFSSVSTDEELAFIFDYYNHVDIKDKYQKKLRSMVNDLNRRWRSK